MPRLPIWISEENLEGYIREGESTVTSSLSILTTGLRKKRGAWGPADVTTPFFPADLFYTVV